MLCTRSTWNRRWKPGYSACHSATTSGSCGTWTTYLVTGGVPDGDHVKKLQDADDIYELRVALDRTTWRISFWKPGGRGIILLTVDEELLTSYGHNH